MYIKHEVLKESVRSGAKVRGFSIYKEGQRGYYDVGHSEERKDTANRREKE